MINYNTLSARRMLDFRRRHAAKSHTCALNAVGEIRRVLKTRGEITDARIETTLFILLESPLGASRLRINYRRWRTLDGATKCEIFFTIHTGCVSIEIDRRYVAVRP